VSRNTVLFLFIDFRIYEPAEKPILELRTVYNRFRIKAEKMKKYIFDPYEEIYPSLFDVEKERILSKTNSILQIEHVGSTAVPGLGGKGIIDIAILAEKEDLSSVTAILQTIGYEFKPFFNTSNHLYFIANLKDPQKGTRRYHIHLICKGHNSWDEFIEFRDYLLSHPDAREEYAAIKEKAVHNKIEGEQYRKIKDPFIKKILYPK
jgi:GrpB-like predicted nucleotidyltransferase (UPF0157 family)